MNIEVFFFCSLKFVLVVIGVYNDIREQIMLYRGLFFPMYLFASVLEAACSLQF